MQILRQAISQMHLSARSFHRVLKLSRTIADLEGGTEIKTEHVTEALQYRPRSALL
jgi:magnesium chelatase family protein